MCGTTGVGGGAMPTMKLSGSATGGGDVAGAAGGGSTTALPSGGADLGAILLQLQKSIEALVQALSGNAALGGGGSTTQTGVAEQTGVGDTTGGGEAQATGGGDPAQTEAAKAEDKPEDKPGKTYTVQRGDTLGKIARAHGVSVDALYELNKELIGPDRNKIKPGQELKLPEGAKDPAQGGGNPTQGGGDRPRRGNGRGNRGRGNGNGGGDRPNPGRGNGNGNGNGNGSTGASGGPAAPTGGERPTGGGGPSPAERTRLQERRTALRNERSRLASQLEINGGRAGTQAAVERIRRIDAELRDINSALNGRGN